ncbi:MAG: hypothetical protein NZ824_00765 [Candidatus Thioglobus sp.]|nr:hypothetical protein [Thiotrichales bacterium]MCS5588478.1 hypothetical protein [Candidatus Thioglobus sp.]|tara:strand:+ start:208 stop:510 length:303 start_codon:yes stop_codon:yes gene_type:complete
MQDKTTTNLTNFKPAGGLGSLFEKAKMHNHLNSLFQKALPSKLNGLTLCLVEEQKVTLLATNASVAFRAEKQRKTLLSIVQQVDGLSHTTSVLIKIEKIK